MIEQPSVHMTDLVGGRGTDRGHRPPLRQRLRSHCRGHPAATEWIIPRGTGHGNDKDA